MLGSVLTSKSMNIGHLLIAGGVPGIHVGHVVHTVDLLPR